MSELICTYNIELTTDSVGYGRISSMLTLYQRAYDACAKLLVDNDVRLDIKSVHDTAYGYLRSEFPELPAQFAIKVYKDVLAALRSAKSNKHKEFQTPAKKNLSARLDKRTYGKFTSEGIELTVDVGNGGRVKCGFVLYDKVREMFSRYPTQDPLVFMRDGRVFLSVPFVMPKQVADNDTAVGIDLGMKRFFVTSEGKVFQDKEYLGRRRRIRFLKRKLQSKGTKSAKRKLRKARRRERNMADAMCHKAANLLLSSTQASVIVMEDLTKIKKTTSRTKDGHNRKRHNNAISQVPFHMFKQIVGYKAQRQGRTLVAVNPSYTSQTDSRTNRRDGKRQGCRYICSDGVQLDADFNAAINIARRGRHPLSSEMLPTSGNMDFMRQGAVNRPNVSGSRRTSGASR